MPNCDAPNPSRHLLSFSRRRWVKFSLREGFVRPWLTPRNTNIWRQSQPRSQSSTNFALLPICVTTSHDAQGPKKSFNPLVYCEKSSCKTQDTFFFSLPTPTQWYNRIHLIEWHLESSEEIEVARELTRKLADSASGSLQCLRSVGCTVLKIWVILYPGSETVFSLIHHWDIEMTGTCESVS